jgi:hypothetical protein
MENFIKAEIYKKCRCIRSLNGKEMEFIGFVDLQLKNVLK